MKMTIVVSMLFITFTCCMGIVAWLAITSHPFMAVICLFTTLLIYGNVKLKTSDIAKCPDCHKVFKIDIKEGE